MAEFTTAAATVAPESAQSMPASVGRGYHGFAVREAPGVERGVEMWATDLTT